MQNKQLNGFPFKKQMASCPFNPAHTFEKQKLVFHISRCKDKQKRLPYMSKCKYNPMHYVDKDKLQLHEQFCADRKINQDIVNQCQIKYRNALRDDTRRQRSPQNFTNDRNPHERQNRNRSRQRKLEESEAEKQKKQKLEEDRSHHHDEDLQTFSDCEECQNIVRKYKQKIMQNEKISKLLNKYQQLAGYSIL